MEQTSGTFLTWLKRHRVLVGITVVFHLLAATYSIGFLHPDEHFQNFEFMMARWGHIGSSHLPWEFAAQMRPWLFPSVIALSAALFKSDIFALETLWRFLCGALGLWSTLFFIYHGQERRRTLTVALTLCCLFFWFLPFVHVRTSGENVGTSLFVLGLIPFFSKHRKWNSLTLLIAGISIGLSIQFRYHIGIMFVALLAYEFRQYKRNLLVISGAIVATIICAFVDRLGYGAWAFPPLNYVLQNIIENKASHFGVSPWYWYFTKINVSLYPPISIFIIASFIWQWYRRFKSRLTALTLPFFAIHCLVGHKEMRFLIPMIPFALIIGADFYRRVILRLRLFSPRTWRIFLTLTAIYSLCAMTRSALLPASNDYAFLSKWSDLSPETRPNEVYYIGEESPFNMYQLDPKSLVSFSPQIKRIETFSKFESLYEDNYLGHDIFIIAKHPADLSAMTNQYPHCKLDIISSEFTYKLALRTPVLFHCQGVP